MKLLKHGSKALVFALVLFATMTVFAQRVYSTTIYVAQGSSSDTFEKIFEAGYPAVGFRVTKINGSNNPSIANSTSLHILMIDQNDTNVMDKYSYPNYTMYNQYLFVKSSSYVSSSSNLKWHAKFSTLINGISYHSFESNLVDLYSTIS